jgi:hypothetical protein
MKVLFIGNSHTYFNDMPQLFADMCEALTGEQTEVTMLAYSGRSLRWHTKEYFPIRFALLYGKYDFCVIQQQGHPFPGLSQTEPDAEALISLCRTCGTKPVLYMTWAKKDEPEKIREISAAYRTLSERCDALLAPIGELFEALRVSHPEIDLYWSDGAHASKYATYLIAAAFASLLTGCNDLSRLPDRTLDFASRFDAEHPQAETERSRLSCEIEPETAAILRATAVSVLKSHGSECGGCRN